MAVAAAGLVSTTGCPGSRSNETPVLKSCASNQDCEPGWACLTGHCYDTRKSAAFTHPEQQVTPDRIRQEVEHQQDLHMRRMDKDLQATEPSGN